MANGFFGIDDDAFLAFISKKDVYNALTLDSVERFLQSLGVRVDRYADHLICPTICHNCLEEAESMKLYYYQENKMFHCYTQCGENMSIFELYKRFMSLNHYDISEEQAENDLKKFFAGDINFGAQEQQPKTRETFMEKYRRLQDVIYCESYPKFALSVFQKYHHPLWKAEGITDESMDKFRICFSPTQNKIIIPHFDLRGELIGIRGRAINPEDVELGKYRPIKIGDTTYVHQLGFNLYGIHEHEQAIRKLKRAIIFEGEKSVLQDDGFFGPNSVGVAICGSSLNKFQVNLLVKKLGVNEIILALDKEYENPRSEEGIKYREKLIRMGRKYSYLADFSYIFDEEGLLNRKDAPVDKGKDVFERLYRKRITVR